MFPTLINLFKHKDSLKEHLYVDIEEGGEDSAEEGEAQKGEVEATRKLCDIVLTPDHYTTGFLEELQLVIQLWIDQQVVRAKVLAKN